MAARAAGGERQQSTSEVSGAPAAGFLCGAQGRAEQSRSTWAWSASTRAAAGSVPPKMSRAARRREARCLLLAFREKETLGCPRTPEVSPSSASFFLSKERKARRGLMSLASDLQECCRSEPERTFGCPVTISNDRSNERTFGAPQSATHKARAGAGPSRTFLRSIERLAVLRSPQEPRREHLMRQLRR